MLSIIKDVKYLKDFLKLWYNKNKEISKGSEGNKNITKAI